VDRRTEGHSGPLDSARWLGPAGGSPERDDSHRARGTPPRSEAADKAGYERGQASSASNQSYTAQQIESERDDLRERIRVFEEASGLSLDFGRYDGASLRDYAATVRLVVESQGKGWEKPLARLRNARDAAQRFLERTDELIGESTLDLSA